MVRVADCIMGTGKSSAAITYMNEHPDSKFIYITPYLEEAKRIYESCPRLRFVEPNAKLEEYSFKKSNHIAALIDEGRNISSTHQAFCGYTPAMLERIREQGYTLVVDENVDVLEKYTIHPDDLNLAVSAGIIQNDDGVYTLTGKEYNGNMLHELIGTMRSRELVSVKEKIDSAFYYWTLSPSFITSFKDVFILTYLFDGQSLHHLLEIYSIPYEMIGVVRDEDGTYRFGEYPGHIPEYVYRISDMIHILENDKLNSIGDEYYDLSINWRNNNPAGVEQLKRNIDNYFKNICKDIPAEKRLWGSFKSSKSKLRGKGYTGRFLAYNARATNKFRECIAIEYDANVFMHPAECKFYRAHGIEVDQELYALSVVCQFIWRSAIRDGKEIYLYIPSSRMRHILKSWIASLPSNTQEGGCEDDL